jgi:hypothetical protein
MTSVWPHSGNKCTRCVCGQEVGIRTLRSRSCFRATSRRSTVLLRAGACPLVAPLCYCVRGRAARCTKVSSYAQEDTFCNKLTDRILGVRWHCNYRPVVWLHTGTSPTNSRCTDGLGTHDRPSAWKSTTHQSTSSPPFRS